MLIETNDNEIKLTFSKNIIELSEIQNIIDFIKPKLRIRDFEW